MELVFSGSESLGPLSLPLGGRLKGTQKRARKRALLGPRWFARNRNNPFGKNGGDDETRTRDLCRDSDQWSGRWESNPVNQHYDGPLITSKYWDSNNWAPPTRCAKARSGTVPSHDDNGFIIEWLYASAKCMECRCQSCAERFGGVAVNRPRNIHKAV